MSQHSHAETPPKVPSALVNRSREGWHAFTKAIVWNCIAIAALLLFMLLVFKIL
jgi:hypothetical protein